MECPSCYEYFDNEERIPRSLLCGHTFCEDCLLKIEQQRITFCPICRTALVKNFKAKKLPKNFIALELALKHHDLLKKNSLCPAHPKEPLRLYCNTCKCLMCAECIIEHSGHEFVRKEESSFVLEENAEQIVKSMDSCMDQTQTLISKGEKAKQVLQQKRDKDLANLDNEFDSIITRIKSRKTTLRDEYLLAMNHQLLHLDTELENYLTHQRLLNFNSETIKHFLLDVTTHTPSPEDSKNKAKEISNKLENFKRQE